jgi:Fuc2NAc and GlcNAc transferase
LSDNSACAGLGLLLAVLGFMDDRHHISVHWRLLAHVIVCVSVLFIIGGMPAITIFSWSFPSCWLLNTLAVIYLVWLINLYNFMDGIDGIASFEAISVCLSAIVVYFLTGDFNLIASPLLLASSVAGFVCWNFPKARIFMGDVGSSFLGFILGLLSIQASLINQNYFWSWLILLGIFIVDATTTLLYRAFLRAKLYEAHRNHAYQHAQFYFGSHTPVTLLAIGINLFWLLPIAILVGCNYLNGMTGLLIAYLPLVIIAFLLKAGQKLSFS